MLKFIVQYLLSPIVFPLTFVLPIVVYLINRRYVWFSILLTVIVEVMMNWVNFYYYESRGLMTIFTLVQIAVMAILILILKEVGPKIKR